MPDLQAHRIAELLTSSSDEENSLVDEILIEVQRQLQIKLVRLDRRRKLRRAVAMGSQLDLDTRINRVCSRIFGDPSRWFSVARVTPRISDPHFNWIHRADDGTLVAGVDGCLQQVDELITGFVYHDKSGPVKFVRLRSQAKSIRELCVILGLPSRLVCDTTKIDWRQRAFIVAGANHLPWIYP